MAHTIPSATIRRSIAGSIWVWVALFTLPLAVGCGAKAAKQTACDGLVYTDSGFSRAEYLPCAGEMIATLERMEPQIEAMLAGKEEARSEMKATMRELGSLMQKAGGRNLRERWADHALSSMNLAISNTYNHHQGCLMVASQLFGRGPLRDEKYREAESKCRSYRQTYQSASSAYRRLK